MDTVSVICLIVAVFFLQMHVLLDFLQQYPVIEETLMSVVMSPYPYLLVAAVVGAMIWIFRSRREYGWIRRVKEMMRNLWYGFRTVLTMKQKKRFLIYTVLLWFCYYLQLYLCLFAFADTGPFGGFGSAFALCYGEHRYGYTRAGRFRSLAFGGDGYAGHIRCYRPQCGRFFCPGGPWFADGSHCLAGYLYVLLHHVGEKTLGSTAVRVGSVVGEAGGAVQ